MYRFASVGGAKANATITPGSIAGAAIVSLCADCYAMLGAT